MSQAASPETKVSNTPAASALRDPRQASQPRPLEDMQIEGLDKLLWVYLKLLYTQHSLERFVEQTDEGTIQADVRQLEQRIEQMPNDPAIPQRQRMRKALLDNLETSQTRLANFQKAKDNLALVAWKLTAWKTRFRRSARWR